MKFKTIFTSDVIIKRTMIWLYIFEITYDCIFKIIVQTNGKFVKSFMTNGVSIYEYDIDKVIELCPESVPILIENKVIICE